ncbi:MAG: chemotaxis protein CheD [Desulfobacterales bacterium]
MNLTVLVGDLKTGGRGDTLVTHALGSCLGLVVFDPLAGVGGLLHAMLPLSSINPQKAQANPAMFVDTGVPMLFRTLYDNGAQKSRLIVKAAGCGNPMGGDQVFKIGERNYTVLRKLLWKNNVLMAAEDVGGSQSRTLHFDVGQGQIVLSSNGAKRLL